MPLGLDDLEISGCGWVCQLFREQVIACVAIGYLHDLTGAAQTVDRFSEDNLDHGYSVAKGSNAILRAFLIAWFKSRWCCEQTPEMRRGMIFARSGTNWESSFTSL